MSSDHHLGQILLKHRRFRALLHVNQDLFVIREQWKTLSPALVKNTTVVAIRKQHIVIGVYTPVWQQELLLMKSLILKKCQQWVPKQTLRGIQIRILKPDTVRKKRLMPRRYKKTLSFEQMICAMNKTRRQEGFSLCVTCGVRYTKKIICIVCQAKKNSFQFL